MESIEQTFNGTADFGRKVTCTISRNGDLIHRMYLQAALPTLVGGHFVSDVGEAMLSTIELEIGGQRIDKHYADWLHIWNDLTQPKGHQMGYNTMVNGAANSHGGLTVYVPLQFWFCRNPGLALPLIALQYHEVKVNIEFKSFSSLVIPTVSTVPVTAASLGYCSLWVDYIYLDTDERRRFAQVSHEYLIEQLQFTGDETATGTNNKIKLNFNHPCKELIWVVQPSAFSGAPGVSHDPFNYTDAVTSGNPTGGNPVVTAKVQLNGHDRFDERDGAYFNLVQPYQHHENVPSSPGINVYSFGLKPEEHQPTGTCNFSRIDTATLILQLTPAAVAQNVGGSAFVRIYAVNYNVLRVMSGINAAIRRRTCAKQSAANYGYCSTILDKQCKRNLGSLVYNWLVSLQTCNKIKLSGTPFRALTTTPAWKLAVGTLGNDHGHSKNVKDWVIRSQAPTVRVVSDRVKVQRIDGFGGERNTILCDPLRYIPAPCESMGVETGAVSRIPISLKNFRYHIWYCVRGFVFKQTISIIVYITYTTQFYCKGISSFVSKSSYSAFFILQNEYIRHQYINKLCDIYRERPDDLLKVLLAVGNNRTIDENEVDHLENIPSQHESQPQDVQAIHQPVSQPQPPSTPHPPPASTTFQTQPLMPLSEAPQHSANELSGIQPNKRKPAVVPSQSDWQDTWNC